MKPERASCAVVVPVYRLELTDLEKIALEQYARVFAGRDLHIAAPHRLRDRILDEGCGGLRASDTVHFAWFDDSHFQGIRSYNRLMLSPDFYSRFSPYRYLLIAQTDAFAFEDRIEEFVRHGYDYYGAPWFEGFENADGTSRMLPYSGNGGFSLRKIESFLHVLDKNRQVEPLRFFVERMRKAPAEFWFKRLAENAADYCLHNRVSTFWENIAHYEDYFWARCAREIVGTFSSAPPEIAMRFSFECQPRRLFALNGNVLPMGCHGWWKYEPEFWRGYIDF